MNHEWNTRGEYKCTRQFGNTLLHLVSPMRDWVQNALGEGDAPVLGSTYK